MNGFDDIPKYVIDSLKEAHRQYQSVKSFLRPINETLQAQRSHFQALQLWDSLFSNSLSFPELSKFQSELLSPIRTYQRQLIEATTIHAATVTEAVKAYVDMKTLQSITFQIGQLLPKTDWLPNFRELKRYQQEFILEALLSYGWWPSPSMGKKLYEKITKKAIRRNGIAVSHTILGYYHRLGYKNLEQTIYSWMIAPEFKAREAIIRDAFQAHKYKLYGASIPTLLSQVEGIAGNYVHNNGITTKDGKVVKLSSSKAVVSIAARSSSQVDSLNPVDLTVEEYVTIMAVIRYIEDIAYENVDFALKYKALRNKIKLNRHSILHGIQLKFPSASNSLRCFLLLDSLFGFLNSMTKIPAMP